MLTGSELAFEWNPYVGIPMLIVGLIVLVLVWLFGQPKKEQGTRRPLPEPGAERREPTLGGAGDEADVFKDIADEPMDPLFSEPSPQQGELDVGLRTELEKLGATLANEPDMQLPSSRYCARRRSPWSRRSSRCRLWSPRRRWPRRLPLRRQRQRQLPHHVSRRVPILASVLRRCRWSASSACS
jgi:hypothetical protein